MGTPRGGYVPDANATPAERDTMPEAPAGAGGGSHDCSLHLMQLANIRASRLADEARRHKANFNGALRRAHKAEAELAKARADLATVRADALRVAADDAWERGDIGKEGGREAWAWLNALARQAEIEAQRLSPKTATNAERYDVVLVAATGNGMKSSTADGVSLAVSGGDGNLAPDEAEVHLSISGPDDQFARAWFRLADVESALRQVSQ